MNFLSDFFHLIPDSIELLFAMCERKMLRRKSIFQNYLNFPIRWEVLYTWGHGFCVSFLLVVNEIQWKKIFISFQKKKFCVLLGNICSLNNKINWNLSQKLKNNFLKSNIELIFFQRSLGKTLTNIWNLQNIPWNRDSVEKYFEIIDSIQKKSQFIT